MTEAGQPAPGQDGPGPAGTEPSPEGAGQAFGSGYLLQREIGVGGMGTVWRGWARARQKPVAIKILHPHLSGDRTVVNRFLREGDVLTRLDHPNLVKVHDLVVEGGRLGLVMDLVEGSDLHARRRRRGTLPPAEAARIGAQAAGALAAAHALGVVHLDLKPANILISTQSEQSTHLLPDGAAGSDVAAAVPGSAMAPASTPESEELVEVRLTDFGIARIVDGADQTTTAVTFGTPDYMAPETALDGAASPASDLYALGITLYELVVGRTPYAGGPALTVLARHLERTPRRLPSIPAPLWDVISACTARDPADRPDAVRTAAMLAAAEPALAGLPAAQPLPAGTDYHATSEVRHVADAAAAVAQAEAAEDTVSAFAGPAAAPVPAVTAAPAAAEPVSETEPVPSPAPSQAPSLSPLASPAASVPPSASASAPSAEPSAADTTPPAVPDPAGDFGTAY